MDSKLIFNNEAFSEAVNKAKGLSILLVVLGHFASPLSALIYSFHIPLFFFLGGLFIKTSNSSTSYLSKNFQRLILPYLIFGFIGWLVNLIKNIILHRPLEDFMQSASGLLWWMDIEHLNHYGFVLWFLPALFWARFIVYFMVKYLRINDVLLIVVLILTASAASKLPNLPMGVDNALVALPWVGLGFCFNLHRNKLLSFNWWAIFVAVITLVVPVYFFGMQRLDLATKHIGNVIATVPYTFAVIFIIIYVVYWLSLLPVKLNVVGQALNLFGTYSLAILVAHPYTNNIAHLIVTFFLGDIYWSVKYLLSMVMILGFMYIRKLYASTLFFKYL